MGKILLGIYSGGKQQPSKKHTPYPSSFDRLELIHLGIVLINLFAVNQNRELAGQSEILQLQLKKFTPKSCQYGKKKRHNRDSHTFPQD